MSFRNTSNIIRILNTNNRAISKYNIFNKLSNTNTEYKVSEHDTLIHALMRFSICNVTTLAVTDLNDNVIGSFSQKMYMKNISWLEGRSNSIYIGDIYQSRDHDSVANFNTNILSCYDKVIQYNLNDLLILDNNDYKKFGIVSTNDIIYNILKNIE